VVARGIGDRRRTLLALAESEARFRTVADTAPVLIWQAGAGGACTFVNRGWLTFTGRTLEQERGDGWADSIHREDRDRSLAAFRQAYAERSPFSIEYRFRRSDGAYRLVRNDGVPHWADDATFVGFVGACLDVTEMREAGRRLGEAQRLESLGRLAGGVAHETNNQMTVVLGAAEFLLRRTDLPPAAREDVGQIRQAAGRAANISAQLLAYSRRSVLRPQVLDLNTVVAGIQPSLRRVLGGERTLLVERASAAGPVEADPGQLEQVLLNLIINARDATEEGGRVTIATGQARVTEADAGRRPELAGRTGLYARLTISDTGRGMSAETVSRIFEPFFTTKPVGQGTGLGLATVYGIVKQSNGFIWATSEEGRGTSFEILLPVVPGGRPARDPAPQPVLAGADHLVLVVEDEDTVREFAVRGLSEAGFTVLSATGATEALALVDRDRPPLSAIVTDLAMPGLDGGALAEQLRRRYPAVPVLYMSGFTDDDVIRRGLMAPEQPFLQKPFGPDELARRVKALVEGAATA
jgi:PAS domain S-box-containing protein